MSNSNPYLDVVDNTFNQESVDPKAVDYGAVIDALPDSVFTDNSKDIKLADYLRPAENFSLDEGMSGGLDVSIENGVSFSEAYDNKKFYEQQKAKNIPAVKDTLTKLDKFAPKTRDALLALGVPGTAAMWKDFESGDVGAFERLGLEGGIGLDMGAIKLNAQEINYKRLIGSATDADREKLAKIENALLAYNTEFRKDEGWWTGSYRSMFSEFVPSILSIAKSGAETGLMVGTGAAAVGSVVPAVGTTIGAGTGFGTGFAMGAGAEIYRQSAGEAYAGLRDLKDAQGNQVLDRETAQALAVTAGLGMAALDAAGQVVGFNQLRGIPFVDKALSGISGTAAAKALQAMSDNPTVVGMVGDAGKRILTALAAESGTEALQEGLLIGAEAIGVQIGQGDGFVIDHASSEEIGERLFGAAEGAAKATFLPALFGGIGGAGMSYRLQRRQAEVEQENISRIGNYVRTSEIFDKAPTFAKQLVANITEGQPLYFEANDLLTLYQSEGGADIIASMGLSEGDIANALDMQVDIAVPIANQVELMRSDFWQGEQGLQSKVKMNPRSQSPQMIDAIFSGDIEDTTAVDEFTAMLNEVNADAEKRTQWLTTTENYRYQLEQAGYTPKQAEDFSLVLGAHAEIMSPLFGETPQAYLERKLKGFEVVTATQYGPLVKRFKDGQDFDLSQERAFEEAAKMQREGMSPVVDSLMGQVDADNFKQKFGKDAYNAIVKRYGRKFFATKDKLTGKGGFPLDSALSDAYNNGLIAKDTNPDEVADWLAGDSAARRGLFQGDGTQVNLAPNGNVIEVSSADLGVDDSADIKDFIKAAKKYHDELKEESTIGNPVINVALDKPIRFSSRGWKKNVFGGANRNKWKMFPHLRTILETAELVNTEEIDPATEPNFTHFHWLENNVSLDGKVYRVGFSLAEDKDGNLFYNLNSDVKKGSNLPSISKPGELSLYQDANSSDNINISIVEAPVNRVPQATPNTARGAFVQRPLDGQAMIALFKGKKDISTVIHEGAGHMFLENLREAASLETAPQWVKDDWATVANAIGADVDPTKSIGRDAHEKYARMATEYFRQGKAPRPELTSAFRMFSKWLAEIYKFIKRRFGDFEDISPEVARVMDRLLATDEDIKKAEKLYPDEDIAPENVDVNKWAEYLQLKAKAKNDAAAALELRRVEAERSIRRESTIEANILMTSDHEMLKLRRLKKLGGINAEDLQQVLSEEGVIDARNKWNVDKRALIKKDGLLSVDDVMSEMGFSDMNDFLVWMLEGMTEKDFRENIINERLQEWEASYSPEAEYVGSVASDMALQKRDELLSGQEQISSQDLIFTSDKMASSLSLTRLDGEYEALLAKEQKEAARALSVSLDQRQQKTKDKLTAKVEETIGAERLRRARLGAAYRARIEREDIKRKVRRLANSSTINVDFRQQILQLMAMYKGLGRKSQVPRGAVPSLHAFFRAYAEANGMDITQVTPIPAWLSEHLELKNVQLRFNDLTIEQMRDLYQLIKQLEHKGRLEGKLLNDVDRAEVEATAKELVKGTDALSGTKHINEHERKPMLGMLRKFLREQHASKTIFSFIWKQMDGFISKGSNTSVGPVEEFMRQLNVAENKELALNRETTLELENALLPLAKMNTDRPFKIDGVPLQDDVALDWGGMFTMEKVFAIALNMGNEGNKTAIREGYGWNDEDLVRILNYMTPELWQSVQQIWDTIDKLYPLINDVYKKENGIDMVKVEASPYVTFLNGHTIEVKGGYYPLIFDKNFSKVAAANDNFDALNSHEAVLRKPNTASGMTKERKGGKLPPMLSLTALSRHVTDSIRYATFTLPLRDIYKVVSTKTFENSFNRAFGVEMYAQLLPWLRSMAQPENKLQGSESKIVDWLTKRGTFAVLAFSVRTALMGFASVSNSAHRVGWGNLLGNMAKFAVNPFKYVRIVRDLSPYMQNRSNLLDRDIHAATRKALGGNHLTIGNIKILNTDKYNSAAFAMITAIDAVVAMPTWLAQYEKSLAESNDMNKALLDADAAVYEAQSGAGRVNTSAMMRDPGAARLLTVFMTFANKHYNQQSYYWRGFVESMRKEGNSSLSYKDFAVYLASTVFIPGLVVSMMFGMGQEGELPEEEEYLFWEPLSILLMGNPILRLIPSGIRYGSTGKLSALRGVENVGKMFTNGYDIISNNNTSAKKMDAFMWSSLHAAGFFAKLPTVQLQRTVKGLEAQDKGKGGPAQFILGPSYQKGKKN